ncbi:DNA repair RAD51-like protein 3 [Nymphaea thermarum]|nr:DNA repair RAD51-like protein 3 [Nymphaea thermarum]
MMLGAETAWDMLQEEETCRHITTSCEELDNILGGGIHCKELTEIAFEDLQAKLLQYNMVMNRFDK